LPGSKGLRFGAFFKTLWKNLDDHGTTDSAAALAYYLLLALFPFLFFMVTLLAFLPVQQAFNDAFARLSDVMPAQALALLKGHAEKLVNTQRPHLLTAGLLVSIWIASRGVDSFRKGLNLAYDVKESRPWWRVNAYAVGMTIAGAILILFSLTLIALGGKFGELLADKLNIERYWAFVWSWLRWPLTSIVVMFLAAVAYWILPDVVQEFKFITPGSIVATVLWLLATWGFTQYAEHFGNYDATYGSIGGVVVLMTWLYLSGFIFLLGGEINAVIEHASPDGKDRGARAPGEAPAPVLERPSAGQGKEGEHPVLDPQPSGA
jgi:membrane protein